MKACMIWCEMDKKQVLAATIQHATAYYEKKYSMRPNLCFVPIGASAGVEVDGVAIEERQFVTGVHIQVGVSDG